MSRNVSRAFIVSALMLCCSVSRADAQFTCRPPKGSVESVRILNVDLGGVPALVRIPKSAGKPPIILWHGFGPPASEQALMDALPLDDVPAIKVYLGLPLFGKRAPAGGVDEIIRRQSEDFASLLFEPSVMGAAKELPAVTRSLIDGSCMKASDNVGLFGFSAGGASVLFALSQRQVPIGIAVTVNASTGLSASIQAFERVTKKSYAWTPRAKEIAAQSDAPLHAADIASGSPPPALLLLHGAEDKMLTPQVALTLHDALLPLYRSKESDRRLQLEIIPGMSHAWMQGESLNTLRLTIAKWFNESS